ncbi:MAG: hypothetical protein A2297_07225 [Elusimicrobia bacterium RIFOXYB2_FULL_48_7]|nr:MAG: hypothetical protein A2297_07225 [Elusimicrobia bacterium RIFOXYB2_FULL_48_7]
MSPRCPGNDGRFLKVEIHKCPKCAYEVEMFSDEALVKCPKCKSEITRNPDTSCISWCKFAKQCIGENKWNEIRKIIDADPKRKK